MLRLRSALRRIPVVFAAAGVLAACGDDKTTENTTLAGTYRATTFRVTPTGQSAIDALAQGGTMTLAIAADNSTNGLLTLPASVTGGSAFTASMAGSAVRTDNTVRFQQTADSFVRDLSWTVSGSALTVVDQTAGSARFTITLTRQ
ncbi:MAG TPA: hypothetical protein VGE27_08005 [Gemmatimonas sp.]|uniref:hypothetical protein n=1 Tax=Gemmatimonas sp. TaxID=1962908 RepID=UPI002EDAD8BC